MSGHRRWSEIRHKRDEPTEEELEAARERLRPYRNDYPEPMIDARRLRIAEGVASEQDKREIRAEDQVIREWNQQDAKDFDAEDGIRYRRSFTPTQLRDYEQVDRIFRHTRPLVSEEDQEKERERERQIQREIEEAHEIQERLLDDIPEVTEVEDNAIEQAYDRLAEFIGSHINAMKMERSSMSSYGDEFETYVHVSVGCKHCEALADLNAIFKELSEWETTAMALDRQLEEKAQLVVDCRTRIYQLQQELAVAKHDLGVQKRRADSCQVELHDQKRHELGLMCAEAQEKLNKIARAVHDCPDTVDAAWLAAEIEDILEGVE